MVSVQEAIEFILENTVVLDQTNIGTAESLGLVISQDIISPVNLPLFNNSAMDGYALRSEDTETASAENPVCLKINNTIRAGDFSDTSVNTGECAKIMTGAAVPGGADAVVKIEDVTDRDGNVILTGKVEKSLNVRFEGEEIGRGEVALGAGVDITPAAIGFLAELGIKSVGVYRAPGVSVIVTGEELTGPDEDVKPGRIRDTNSIMLKTALSKENIDLVSVARVADNKSDIEEATRICLDSCDILIITGGVSVGEYDFVKDILAKLGVEKIFWGVSQRPGGPMFFGRRKDTLVFGLPGNPASSLVCYYEYVRPAIRKMAGKKDIFLREENARLLVPIKKKPGKKHFLRGYVSRENDRIYVRTTGEQGSHMLKSFALSNSLIILSEDDSSLPQNSMVKVHFLP